MPHLVATLIYLSQIYSCYIRGDRSPLLSCSLFQVEKKVVEHMNHALKYCDTTVSSPLQATCQFRAATIHHRLASLHHNAFRNQVNIHNAFRNQVNNHNAFRNQVNNHNAFRNKVNNYRISSHIVNHLHVLA